MINKKNLKNIIITGGSRGIGYDIAQECVRNNYRVILISINKKNLQKTIIKLNKINNFENFYFNLDISNIKNFKKVTTWLKINKVKIKGLINCAGILGPIGKTNDVDMKFFKKTFDINFYGTMNSINSFIPHFKSNENKKIINLAGGGAAYSFPNFTAYSISKISLVRYTENLSYELKYKNFNINAVSPGFINTDMHKSTLKSGSKKVGKIYFDRTKKLISEGGQSRENLKKLIIFLLSNKSDKINGKLISAQWDDKIFLKKLNLDKNLGTLRRIDNRQFKIK